MEDEKLLRKKLQLYEKFVNDLKELELDNLAKKEENKEIKESTLSESYMVVETGKNLKELPNRELKQIKEQDNLYSYNKIKEYVDKTNTIASFVKYVQYGVSIGKWLLFI